MVQGQLRVGQEVMHSVIPFFICPHCDNIISLIFLGTSSEGNRVVQLNFTPEIKCFTERGVLSVVRFCYVFPCELRGPAWAVGSYSISQSAGGTSQNIIYKTLRQIGRPALYMLFDRSLSIIRTTSLKQHI